jgi:TRAP-type C4-dicarboxylate transport system permease large subunit
MKKLKDRRNPDIKKAKEKRAIKEAYRQAFGVEYTQKYGRNIGWFVFTTACEKLSYPTFILIFMILGFWTPLLMTLGAEVALYVLVITLMHKNHRIRNCIKAILYTPIRYSQIMFELFVAGKLMIDLWVTKNRRWRK